MAIKIGIILTSGDPRTTADLAALAEEHGWDGVFTWDGISIGTADTYLARRTSSPPTPGRVRPGGSRRTG